MDLNIEQLLGGDVNRLAYAFRYNTDSVSHRESVAEHCFFVAFYSMAIAEWVEYNTSMIHVDVCKLLQAALLHDLDESRTGDVPRSFKYSSPKLKEALDEGAVYEFETVIMGLTDHRAVVKDWAIIWHDAKNTTANGRILALADYLCVVSYFWREQKSGNIHLLHRYKKLVEYSQTFNHSSFDFLRPLISQTQKLIGRITDGYV